MSTYFSSHTGKIFTILTARINEGNEPIEDGILFLKASFQMSQILFEPFQLGSLKLANRLVMAPMTRSQSTMTVSSQQSDGSLLQ